MPIDHNSVSSILYEYFNPNAYFSLYFVAYHLLYKYFVINFVAWLCKVQLYCVYSKIFNNSFSFSAKYQFPG